jgi:hypothetical protein
MEGNGDIKGNSETSGEQPSGSQEQKPRGRADHLKPHWFPPGKSGNPAGGAKGRRSLSAVLNALLDGDLLAGKKLPPGKQVIDVLAEAIVKHACSGKVGYAEIAKELRDGKTPIRIAGYDGGPLQIQSSVSRLTEDELRNLEELSARCAPLESEGSQPDREG